MKKVCSPSQKLVSRFEFGFWFRKLVTVAETCLKSKQKGKQRAKKKVGLFFLVFFFLRFFLSFGYYKILIMGHNFKDFFLPEYEVQTYEIKIEK